MILINLFVCFFLLQILQPKPLKPLRDEIKIYINRLSLPSMQAIDTSDMSQWFSEPFNSTYGFLYQVNSTSSHVSIRFCHHFSFQSYKSSSFATEFKSNATNRNQFKIQLRFDGIMSIVYCWQITQVFSSTI